jgi:hypothetical protein
MGDTLREDFEDRELVLDFFPDSGREPERLVSLSAEEADLGLDADDLRFFASGIDFDFDDDDSFCFLLVGGLCTFVASTLLFLRFLLVAVVVDSGRCPVTGSRFSLAALPGGLFDIDCDSDVSALSEALGLI